MFAILGLVGPALSTVMITGPDWSEQDTATDSTGSMPSWVKRHHGFQSRPQTMRRFFYGSADDLVETGSGNDLVDAEGGNDTIFAGAGDDEIHGGRGNDVLHGMAGDDALFGHVGDDTVYGGAGADGIIGGDGDDYIAGDDGDDRLQGYLGDDTLIVGNGDDVLFGGSGDDLLDGRDVDAGQGFLNGGSGDDVLLAGVGDNLNGGTGADQFGLTIGGNAFIDDFDPDEDRISVSYDAQGDAPIVRYEDTDEGALLIADGQIVATFAGHAALDLAGVPIVFTALDPAA